MKHIALSFLFTLAAVGAHAGAAPLEDEPVQPREVLLREGFRPPSQPNAPLGSVNVPAAHSLKWPVLFQDPGHSIGNSMAEYQPYGSPYWHGGCDLRVNAGAEVKAPLAGRIEAGHYSYANNADGSMSKYWKPWPEAGNDTYFEVAVISDDGNRYEFHHVNRTTLPEKIVSLLNAGGGRVEAGETLGYAIRWSDGVYHHIHYNVIAPDGTRINPEHVSTLVPDHQKPAIQGVYAIMPGGVVKPFGNGELTETPTEFVIAVIDKKDQNTYVQPPTRTQLKLESGAVTGWDFSQLLAKTDGSFPALFEFYAKSLTTSQGKRIETSGGYGTGLALVRVPVPKAAVGRFTIEVSDAAGNVTELKGKIGP